MAHRDWLSERIAESLILDKDHAIKKQIINLLNKTNNIFVYTGLPETIPAKWLEMYLQVGGHCVVAPVEDKGLFALQGGWGGMRDPYYQPLSYMVANPWLNFTKELIINKDCVLCRNDTLADGIYDTIAKYSQLIVENLISFRVAAINSRVQFIIDATDDSAAESAREFLKKVEKGELGVVSSDDLISKINVNPASSTNKSIIELIELHQYLLSQLYMEIGIPDNYNMKRERLTRGEAQMITSKPKVSLEDMFRERCLFCDRINDMYGTNIRVDINERWETVNDDIATGDSGLQDSRSDEGNGESDRDR